MKIIAVYTQLKQLRNKAWKKFRPERESNPWPLRIPVQYMTFMYSYHIIITVSSVVSP